MLVTDQFAKLQVSVGSGKDLEGVVVVNIAKLMYATNMQIAAKKFAKHSFKLGGYK